jgi:arsenate reductase (thioredoxin)
MLIFGINGSPRKGGNTRFLLSLFLEEMRKKGHEIQVFDATRLKINPCTGCGNCEKKGVCVFKDDFTDIFLPVFKKADIIVLSSPVYFYGFPAGIKSLIDRIQVLWSRKYVLGLKDFQEHKRKGFLLSAGATKGKDLFDGLKLTAKYFFDAAQVKFENELCYRGIENKGDLEKHPAVHQDIKKLADSL